MFPLATVNVQPFTCRKFAGAIVALQLHIRLAVHCTKAIAQRLNHGFVAVAQFDKRAQIQVDAFITAEYGAQTGGRIAAMPVQVDADLTEVIPLGQADRRFLFGQRNFAEIDLRRCRRRSWR